MGQKINPLAFRLGTTQDHYSIWFAQPKNYSESLEEDQKRRDSIQNFVKKNRKEITEEKIKQIKEENEQKNVKKNREQIIQKLRRMGLYQDPELSGIARIEIQKTTDLIQVRIYLGFTNVFEKSTTSALQMNLEKELHSVKKKFNPIKQKFRFFTRKINIATTIIEEPYINPIILAQYIAGQLKQKVSFQKAMEGAIEKTKKTRTKGIRIQIAGRFVGKDIARVQWTRKGRVPLQTLRAKMDYCFYPVRTWGIIYKNIEKNNSLDRLSTADLRRFHRNNYLE